MTFIDISHKDRKNYNSVVTHPLQSYEWGEFRKATGVTVIRRGLVKNEKIVDGFTLTIHRVPKTRFTIGYLPKGNNPTKEILAELNKIGKEYNCIFIQIEPNIINSPKFINHRSLKPSFHPLFTKYTFILDLTKSEEELMKNFHSKTRYNIKISKKHGVKVIVDNSKKSFEKYLSLIDETTKRQKFYAHGSDYHIKMWETLKSSTYDKTKLQAHLLIAKYKNKILATWVLFTFKNTLYYPYGASSSEHRNVMASNLIMWEAILFGKKLGLKYFDMWGALGTSPKKDDPWYGFHKFKEGYGATHTEFVGSYDLVINPTMYQLYKIADKVRWAYLRIKKSI